MVSVSKCCQHPPKLVLHSLTQLFADLLWRRWTRSLWRSGKIHLNLKDIHIIFFNLQTEVWQWRSNPANRIGRYSGNSTCQGQGIALNSLHPTSVLLILLHWHTFPAVRGDGGAGQRQRRVHLRVHCQRSFHRQPAQEESIQEANGPGGEDENWLSSFLYQCQYPQPVDEHDPRKIGDMFQYCEDGSKTLYYHL